MKIRKLQKDPKRTRRNTVGLTQEVYVYLKEYNAKHIEEQALKLGISKSLYVNTLVESDRTGRKFAEILSVS